MKPVILVVDDDSAIGELLSDVLSAHVFDVLLCQTGSDALAVAAQRTDISLVLLDMILPDTNGLLVLQQLQRSRPDFLDAEIAASALSLTNQLFLFFLQ